MLPFALKSPDKARTLQRVAEGVAALTYCRLQDDPLPGAAHTSNKSTTPPTPSTCQHRLSLPTLVSPAAFPPLFLVFWTKITVLSSYPKEKLYHQPHPNDECFKWSQGLHHLSKTFPAPQLFVGISSLLSQVPAFTFALWCMKLLCGCYSANLN